MKTKKKTPRAFNAIPDTLDFRDQMYIPTLVEVPKELPLANYIKHQVPVLDQGHEGSCTGFGLATVAHFLLKTRKGSSDATQVSPRMLYEMARKYDEWPGEEYIGSSARGAMKGWHKHGVCSALEWPHDTKVADTRLSTKRSQDALNRPLGAYFRVNHKDIVAMHSAIAEVGILFATGTVHAGWEKIQSNGVIPPTDQILGGHAFALVGFDRAGFWIQNSWGSQWGKNGFAQITYDDWLQNGTDVWVARLGAPINLTTSQGVATSHSAAVGRSAAQSIADIRPHIISIGNNGLLRDQGPYGTNAKDVKDLFDTVIPEVTASWKTRRILLYAHGGLVSEKDAAQRVAGLLPSLLEAEIYPVSFIWKSGFWTTIKNIFGDELDRRRDDTKAAGGIMDFMLERLDRSLESVARGAGGMALWSEMKENAMAASTSANGGARLAAQSLAQFVGKYPNAEIHAVGHSAGSIVHGPLLQYLTLPTSKKGLGIKVKTCTLWAPACTNKFFKEHYAPSLKAGSIEQLALYTLSDKAEQDDNCQKLYHKSLLYLVSNALEEKARIPFIQEDGEPILGMMKFLENDTAIQDLFQNMKSRFTHVIAPNHKLKGSFNESEANEHGEFDEDNATLRSTLKRILGGTQAPKLAGFSHKQSTAFYRQLRADLAVSRR